MHWEEMKRAQEGATVELKGYLFQAVDGEWILSAESDLKACCVGSADKQASQIRLQGEFSLRPTHKPLEVRGILHREEGRYFLAEAQSVPADSFPLWTFCVLLISVVYFVIRRLRAPLP